MKQVVLDFSEPKLRRVLVVTRQARGFPVCTFAATHLGREPRLLMSFP